MGKSVRLGLGFLFSAGVGSSVTRARVNRCPVRMNTVHGDVSADKKTDSERRPGSQKGFVEEMRFVAMKLHTKDQAKEGQQEESVLPINEWSPKMTDYLQFLVDSKDVYDYMEGVIADSDDDMLKQFKNTGLERSKALADDIAWFNSKGIPTPEPTQKSKRYVEYLKNLLANGQKSAFLCHWYNYYFAHTAGGRMIGKMMCDKLLDGHQLEFYKWDRDVKEILGEVRVVIDNVAKDWPREEKDACLNETNLAFSYSGTVLGNLAKRA